MGNLAEARRRVRCDAVFQAYVLTDPAAALDAYDLTGDEMLVLARDLDGPADRRPSVHELFRTT